MTNLKWENFFAHANSGLKPSAIREILKVTRRPGIISFAGGVPDPVLFPLKELSSSQKRVLDTQALVAYQYGLTQGCEELLSELSLLANELGRTTTVPNLLVTNGSQQGLDLVARLFIDPSDFVAVTRPCYLGALQAFTAMQPKFLEVACDEQGPIIEQLKAALSKNPKFFYLVPSFQNPTGQSVSKERAAEILELCRNAGVPVIEDAAYEGLYYDSRPSSLRELESELLAQKGLNYDTDGRVIYLGTFSKIIAPGFRIGWVEAPARVLEAMVVLKQGSDLHSSPINQLVIADFLKHYSREYWQKLRAEYVKKRDLMLSLVADNLSDKLDYSSHPKGGLFIWMQTSKNLDFTELLKTAVDKYSIAFVPGAPFYASNPVQNTLRVSFATTSPEQMKQGIENLAKLIED